MRVDDDSGGTSTSNALCTADSHSYENIFTASDVDPPYPLELVQVIYPIDAPPCSTLFVSRTRDFVSLADGTRAPDSERPTSTDLPDRTASVQRFVHATAAAM